jgi:hypothetical protein
MWNNPHRLFFDGTGFQPGSGHSLKTRATGFFSTQLRKYRDIYGPDHSFPCRVETCCFREGKRTWMILGRGVVELEANWILAAIFLAAGVLL